MRVLYQTFIMLYVAGIHLASLFSEKARAWVLGRKDLLSRMRQAAPSDRPVAWFHCASLGEFEQGRPVIEAFRRQYPNFCILLTFFSPSGYEVRKHYAGADHVFYLPADTMHSVRQFLGIWEPAFAAFVKYEYWYNYLHLLDKKNIPVFVISAIFRQQQYFFRSYGFWFRNHLRNISHLFVQDNASVELLQKAGIINVTRSGDTRFDRVVAVASDPAGIREVARFSANTCVLVCGSTWEADEKLLAYVKRHAIKPVKLIIAPHHVYEAGLWRIERLFGGHAVRFSNLSGEVADDNEVLIIDSIGMLSKLYRYANIAYVGGGFGKGIHNILEAAAYGVPVIFGPAYQKFAEAKALKVKGGGFPVSHEQHALEIINAMLGDHEYRQQAGKICKEYVHENSGATQIIIRALSRFLNEKEID